MKNVSLVMACLLVLCFLIVIISPLQTLLPKPVLAESGDPQIDLCLELGNATGPQGFSPAQIRTAYNLPSTGGHGTIAIICANDYPALLSDANVFNAQYGLPPLNSSNFEKHMMNSTIGTDALWAGEECIDVEWAHAIAPNAKILLVEAVQQYADLFHAAAYTANRSDVVAVSMSFGTRGDISWTFENSYDPCLTSPYPMSFFAASGDIPFYNVSYPACSPNVVAVGGTNLTLAENGSVASEIPWIDYSTFLGFLGYEGGEGGVSKYEPEPPYQVSYGVQGANGHRCTPDVSFAASYMSMYCSDPDLIYENVTPGWILANGTSIGTPCWAGIQSLGLTASNNNFYAIAKSLSYQSCFRDITNGNNTIYNATPGYDLCTGLGSPLTYAFGAWMNSFNVYMNDATQNLTTLDSGDVGLNYNTNINFTWNESGTNNVNLAASVYDANGSLAWEGLYTYNYLGPGSNPTSVSLGEFWPEVGIGTLQVTLTNNSGQNLMAPWSETISIVNSNNPPNAPVFVQYTQTGLVGQQYSYTVNATDPDRDNIRYVFNWGDGSGNTTLGWCPSGATGTATHYWNNVGTYNVTATVYDPYNAWNSTILTVTMNSRSGCPYVYCWNGTSYAQDNNILPASANGNGTDTKDYYLLQQPLVPVSRTKRSSVYSLQIGEYETNIDSIDQVKLIAVDHAQGTSIAVTQDGKIFAYQNLASPPSCVDNLGNNELTQISTINGNISDPSTYYQGNKDDWLLVDFGRVTGNYANLVLRDDQKCNPVNCIDVQVPNATGGWQTVDVLNPRDFWSMEAVNMTAYLPANGDFIVRLLWTQTHRLDYVGLDTSAPAPVQVTSAPPTLAIHSTLGDVTQKLLYDDEHCVGLVNGQQITLWFTLPNQAQGTTRSFILYADGYYYTIT